MSQSTATALTMSAVIEVNRARQQRARTLNVRVGDIMFPVWTKSDLEAWLTARLQGARRMAEVSDPSALLLPALDEELVALVVQENPDAISLLGRDMPVEYREGYAPRVVLGRELVQAHAWRDLPDEGVNLPSGRQVEVVLQFGYWSDTASSRDIPGLKRQARERANASQWDAWRDRPEIALPDLAVEQPAVAEIIVATYGVCVVTGESLLAYGAVGVNPSRWHNTDPWFKGGWCRNRAEAEAARADSLAKLEEIRKELQEKRELEVARQAAEDAKAQLKALTSRDGWQELEYELRRKVGDRTGCFWYIPSILADLRPWVEETKAMIAEVETAFERKALEAQRLAEAEAAGQLLRQVEVTLDTRYGRGHVWVVRPDGTLRQHDGYGDGGRSRYTCYRWTNISHELVLVNEATRVEAGPAAAVTSGVLWRPASVTAAQIEATERLENEHGIQGTFEVDPGLVAKRAQLMEEIRKEILGVAPQEQVGELRLLDISGHDGRQLHTVDTRRFVNWAKAWDVACEGRNAQVVRSMRFAGGVLEFLAYEKWGGMNLNVRWRTLTETEKAVAPPATTTVKAEELAAAQAATVTFTHAGNRDFRCGSCNCCTRLEKAVMQRVLSGEQIELTCSVCKKTGVAKK